MIWDFIKDAVKLAAIAVMLLMFVRRYVRWRRPSLVDPVEKHRLVILLILGVLLVGIKVSEDALTGDSGPLDKSVLLFIHKHVPAELTGLFEAVTFTGSFKFFLPLLVVSSILFASFRRWFDLALVAAATMCGGLTIYGIKTLTDRERPALWETKWYWGTSFPSGHTLETACVAMALALCLGRVWPRWTILIRVAGLVWVMLVGFSRLVLGVHWPSDVLVAMCIGMLIPIGLRFLLWRMTRTTAWCVPSKVA